MPRTLLIVSRTMLRDGFDAGKITREDLARSYFAFVLPKEHVPEVVGPELMAIIETAERDGRVRWRDPDTAESDLNRYMWVEGIIQMLKVGGLMVGDQADTSYNEPFNDLPRVIAHSGIELLW